MGIILSLFLLNNSAFSQSPIIVYNASSPNICDGSATLVDSTVIVNSIVWYLNNGTNQQGNVTATNLCPGTYTVVYSYYSTPTQIDSLSLTFTIGPSSGCNGLTMSINTVDASSSTSCDGSASAIVTGGSAPYIYLWSNGMVGINSFGLCDGNYCCTVSDANGCTVSNCFTISSPSTTRDTLVFVNGTCGPANANGTLTNTANDCNLDYSLVSSGSMTSSTSYYPDSIQTVWTVTDSLSNILATYNVIYVLPANVTAGCYDMILTVSCDTSLRRSGSNGVLILTQNITLSPTAVNQLANEEISIVNPMTELLQIRSNSLINGSVTVFDLHGKIIANKEVNNQSNVNIDSSNFGSGVYFVRIQSDNKTYTRKIVK